MLFFLVVAIFLSIKEWKNIPTSEKEASVYSREFWIFIGATTLALMAFQVIVPTSIPVYNAIVEIFGGLSNLAPPADQIGFYTKFQLWFAVALALLTGVGQYFWWNKMTKEDLKNALITPYIISMVLAAAIITVGKVYDITYIVIVLAGAFTIVANSTILVKLVKKKTFKLSGGSLAHIGLGMILIGIMFSSGYSDTISINMSGLTYKKDWEDDLNKENVLLWINKPLQMKDYEVVYRGRFKKVAGVPGYVKADAMESTDGINEAVALENIEANEKVYYQKGDTLNFVLEENSYFKVEYFQEDDLKFTLYPMSQPNPTMGLISSPDSKRYLTKDLYTHVSAINDYEEPEWNDDKFINAAPGEQFFINDFVTQFESADVVQEMDGVPLEEGDIAVQAVLTIMDYDVKKKLTPVFLIRGNQVGKVTHIDHDLGIKVEVDNIVPEENKFVFKVNTYQKDYVVMKAAVKPMINVLWLGTIIMMIGFSVAIFRRFDEFQKMKAKGLE
jgi:cytochrome c-type biogenesis protein CcmF